MPGTFVLSLDTELAWGSFDRNLCPELLAAAGWENWEGIPRLLDLLCRHRLSATWAFVGHATLSCCSGHPELDAVSYDWYSGDWFKHDPASNEEQHPEWYGRSSFLTVLNAVYPQEVGFHSFSHVIFGNSGTSRRRATQEFEACRKIARNFHIQGDAFVFPRNQVGFLDELRESGFRTFRAPDVTRFRLGHGTINASWGVLADLFAVTPLPVVPYLDHGMVGLPGSMMLRASNGWRRLIPFRSRRARIMKGIDACIRENGIFHLWFHPINLYRQQREMFNILEECFCRLSLLRDHGDLRVMTMGELANDYLAPLYAGVTA